jgi:hypothetical protein
MMKSNTNPKIEMGMKCRDVVTGLEGVVVCISSYLSGCDRIGLQPTEVKDSRPADWVTFDALQLEVVPKFKQIVLEPGKPEVEKTGGPRPEPDRW